MADETMILDGKYRLLRPAGTGGTARVYLGQDTQSGDFVAIKVLRRELLADPDMKARFQREASLLWQIEHPNVVKLFKFEDRAREGLLLVLEWIEGARLDQLLTNETLDGALIVELFAQIASALGAIHTIGIAHRDVKTENVMVVGWPDAPRVKLLDFGIARFTDPKEAALMFQTAVSKVGGTPSYISPEQTTGKPVTAASDVYSLGVLGYLMVSGALPFTGNHFEVLSAHLKDAPRPLQPRDPSLEGHPVIDVIMQCLEKDPADRPADGAAVEALVRAPKKKGKWPFGRK